MTQLWVLKTKLHEFSDLWPASAQTVSNKHTLYHENGFYVQHHMKLIQFV